MTQIRCQVNNIQLKDVQLTANRTYFIQVQTNRQTPPKSVQLTVVPHTPPSNNQCSNATVVDLTVPTVIYGDNAFALPINNTGLLCGTNNISRSHWYKFTNSLATPVSITISTNFRGEVRHNVSIFKGNTCGDLQCTLKLPSTYYYPTEHPTYGFVAEGLTTYYMLAQINGDNPAYLKFALSIDSAARFFNLIDPVTDVALSRLSDFSYDWEGFRIRTTRASTSKLNLQAYFDLPPNSIKSVRMTFDNPKRDVCERKAPYSVFGDSNGDFKNATIQIGRHNVTATPFAQSNCTESVGEAMTQNFYVAGCGEQHFILNGGYDIFLPSYPGPPIEALPCKANIALNPSCEAPIESIHIELRNGTTNGLIQSATPVVRTPYRNKFYYLLFDSKPNGLKNPNVLTGSLKAGSYIITSTINNVTHSSRNFTISSTNCTV